MIEKEITDIIAAALWAKPLDGMSADELDALAEIQFSDDPDVSFSDLDYVPDAGGDLHGVNTPEEQEFTLGDE